VSVPRQTVWHCAQPRHDIRGEVAPAKAELRDTAADEVRRAAGLHLEGKTGGDGFLFKRTYPYMRQLLAAAQVQLTGKIHPKAKNIVFSILKFVEGESEDTTTREKFRPELGGADAGRIADLAVEVARAERSALAIYLQGKSTLADALVHAQRYSQGPSATACSAAGSPRRCLHGSSRCAA